MKNAAQKACSIIAMPWVARALLALVFVVSSRGGQFVISEVLGSPTAELGRPAEQEIQDGIARLEALDQKFRSDFEADPTAYTPEDFFGEMVEEDKLEEELGHVHQYARSRWRGALWGENCRMDRREAMINNLEAHYTSQLGDHPSAKSHASRYAHERIGRASKAVLDTYFEQKRRSEFRGIDTSDDPNDISLADFFGFLASVYWGCMPFVFVLYLTWMREGARSHRDRGYGYVEEYRLEDREWERKLGVRIRNLGSLIIALALYPLFVGRYFLIVWDENRNRLRAEAEIRRTKESLFTMLSDDEVELAKRWAKAGLDRLTIQRQLAASGRHARHSYVAAVAATLVLAFSGGIFVPLAEAFQTNQLDQALASIDIDARAGPCDTDDDNQEPDNHPEATLVFPGGPREPDGREPLPEPNRGTPYWVPRAIEHVPIATAA